MTRIYTPGIEKLRRFSLVMAMVLLTYSLAGVSLGPDAQVLVAGLALKVSRPALLPIGFVLASLYGLLSYYYYAFMLAVSPYRARRDIIDQLNSWAPNFISGRKVHLYFGPTEFETSAWHTDRKEVERYIEQFPNAFPKFARARASVNLISDRNLNKDGDVYLTYAAKVTIPIRCRVAAIFQDIDYSLPVWINCIALIVFGCSLYLQRIAA